MITPYKDRPVVCLDNIGEMSFAAPAVPGPYRPADRGRGRLPGRRPDLDRLQRRPRHRQRRRPFADRAGHRRVRRRTRPGLLGLRRPRHGRVDTGRAPRPFERARRALARSRAVSGGIARTELDRTPFKLTVEAAGTAAPEIVQVRLGRAVEIPTAVYEGYTPPAVEHRGRPAAPGLGRRRIPGPGRAAEIPPRQRVPAARPAGVAGRERRRFRTHAGTELLLLVAALVEAEGRRLLLADRNRPGSGRASPATKYSSKWGPGCERRAAVRRGRNGAGLLRPEFRAVPCARPPSTRTIRRNATTPGTPAGTGPISTGRPSRCA